MSDRTFTPGLAERVLTRASELAAQHEDDALSARELEHIAAEAGVDAHHVRRAILEIDRPPMPRAPWWLGAPPRAWLEANIERARAPRDLEQLVPVIEGFLRENGRLVFGSGGLRWSSRGIGNTQVALRVRGDRLHVQISRRFGHLIGAWFGGFGGGAGGGLGGPLFALVLVETGSVATAALAGAGAVFAALAGARAIYAAIVRARLRRLRALLDELCGANISTRQTRR